MGDTVIVQPIIKKCKHRIGFTDKLAVILVLLLALGLVGGFLLAWKSISHNYMGQLVCYTVVFTPIGSAVSIVIGKIVDKNRDENTGPNGEGIKYAQAVAKNFNEDTTITCETTTYYDSADNSTATKTTTTSTTVNNDSLPI